VTHYPIFYTPFIIAAFVFPSILTICMALAIYLHFLGDTFYTDDGIRWLWPFSKKYFKILSDTMEGMHDKDWVLAYRKTPLYKLEWVFFIATLIIITINAYLLFGLVLFIIAIIVSILFAISIRFIERRMVINIYKKFKEGKIELNEKNER
jgi:hypothetical protein